MAKGTSSRGNAYGTPSSLTSLLALQQTKPVALLRPTTLTFLADDIQKEAQYVRSSTDSRRFHPLGKLRSPGATPRSAGRLVTYSAPTAKLGSSGSLPSRVAFAVPSQVAVCLRRKVRREVLHALYPKRIAKLGSGASRRRTAYSGIKC